jgi:hypothetical protein
LYFSHSTRLLAATTLRNVLGTKNLAEILSERETISQVMQNALDEATDPWGVKVSGRVFRVARWFIFIPKITIWVYFGGHWNGKCWYILWPLGIFLSHLVHFMTIC